MPDYLIVGGSLAGCVIASRLKEYDPSASVTLLEAGPNEHDNPLMMDPMVYDAGGKQLSGTSSVNYAMWVRGGADDYNLWAEMVGDKRWSYNGLLPYFRRTETYYDRAVGDPEQHGFEGPIHTTASARNYPLKEPLRTALSKGTGLPFISDANCGNPIGIAPYTENWRDGKRQPAGKAYGLANVDVVTNAVVRRVILKDKVAVGAELADGRTFSANREVIVSCGAIRTPQILMLSGIGPTDELSKHGIKQLVDSPEVGRNFHDHCCLAMFWKIKNPELGNAAGAEKWNHPGYLLGCPADTVLTASASREALRAAMIADGEADVTDSHLHLKSTRGHIEILPFYARTEAPLTDLNVPFDGTCIMTGVLNLLPTSRGSIRLASSDPTDDPLIDPNYYATQADRVVMREAICLAIRSFETPEGKSFIAEEFTPKEFPALTSDSSDEEIDARMKRAAATWFHSAGGAAMGKVVDTECQVLGAERLKVADPSVLPIPIGAHYQVVTYAIAESMAETIAKKWKAGQ